jgi:emp24/gp25L/p24 family/GOLD
MISHERLYIVSLQITGPNDEPEFSKIDAVSSTFAFTAAEGGSHKCCFTNRFTATRRVMFDFASGVDAKDYGEVATKEHLKPLELELRRLEDRVESIHREMLYQRSREEAHRNTNESTHNRTKWFSILTIFVVVATSSVQVFYLYTFFKRKKYI